MFRILFCFVEKISYCFGLFSKRSGGRLYKSCDKSEITFGFLTFSLVDYSKMEEAFTIYRPETTTGRLEGTYYIDSGNNWRPSLSYKYKIDDIRNQFTPAESYRHALATSGKQIRMIQRLEIRWNHNYPAFVRAAVKIQSLSRGSAARERFRIIKSQLMQDLRRRQIKVTSVTLFENGRYMEAIEEINRNLPVSVELLGIKMKSLYKVKDYSNCIQTSLEIIGKHLVYVLNFQNRFNNIKYCWHTRIDMDILNEQAYYMQACCYVCTGNDDAAYKTMKLGAIQFELPSRNTLTLCAYIATRISPPRFMEAVESLTSILKRNKQDFEAVSTNHIPVLNIIYYFVFVLSLQFWLTVDYIRAVGGACKLLLLHAGLGRRTQRS